MSRATANLILGLMIGTCAMVVVARLKSQRQDDPEYIARKLGKRIKSLENRVDESLRATAG